MSRGEDDDDKQTDDRQTGVTANFTAARMMTLTAVNGTTESAQSDCETHIERYIGTVGLSLLCPTRLGWVRRKD